jgi:hypothetical protein
MIQWFAVVLAVLFIFIYILYDQLDVSPPPPPALRLLVLTIAGLALLTALQNQDSSTGKLTRNSWFLGIYGSSI